MNPPQCPVPVRRRPTPAAWRAAAARLAERFPRERLHPAVCAWAETSPARQRWAIGFSGGADSLALLLLLWAHWPDRRGRMTALHFDHQLRGRAAKADERFCRRVSAALGIGYASARWADPAREASEAAARTARHAFFQAQLRRLRTPALWFGHQQDDIAESMLMRLARGSGLGGLTAPRPVQRFAGGGRVHLRPLLRLKKQELLAALRELRLPWREDATNESAAYLRNRMRSQVIRAWSEAATGRDAVAGAALSRELLEEDEAALEARADAFWSGSSIAALHLQRLRREPRAIIRRVLHRWMTAHGYGEALSRPAFETLLEDIIAGRLTKRSVGIERCVVVARRQLTLQPATMKKGDRFHRAVN